MKNKLNKIDLPKYAGNYSGSNTLGEFWWFLLII